MKGNKIMVGNLARMAKNMDCPRRLRWRAF
jgi:hypothetical protein